MNKLLLITLLVAITVGIGNSGAYIPIDPHKECFANTVGNNTACVNDILKDYQRIYDSHLRVEENYHDSNIFWENTLNSERSKVANKTQNLESEMQLWKAKYHYVIVQHGNYSIQDQISNLTERVSTVETKAKTNESLIYIIQNMLRTVQVDIDSIWLKINSVR